MKILSFIVNRANYGRIKPVLDLLQKDHCIDLIICCTGTTVEESFGNTFMFIERDGHTVKYKSKIEEGGKSLSSMAYTCSNAIKMATKILLEEKPDITLLIGDRYETLGIAIASSFLNIPIAHIQGGELSGSIDENIRHCITKLSHYHFTATERSKNILKQLGENSNNIFNTGCPAGDIILETTKSDVSSLKSLLGIEDLDYILVVYHPTTTEINLEFQRIRILIDAVKKLDRSTIWLTPNSDAGSKLIEEALDEINSDKIKFFTSFSPIEYINIMNNSSLCLGNSSSFLRDSGFLGVPVVLVGNRQNNREYSENLTVANFDVESILLAAHKQIQHGKYPPSNLYGIGDAAKQISQILKQINPETKKEFNII